jgi:hypothetical protein
MDEDVKTGFLGISGIIYLFLGFIIGLLGIGILFSYPDPVWLLGLLFCGSSGLLIYSSIDSFLRFRWKEKDDRKAKEEMKKASVIIKDNGSAQGTAANLQQDNPVLAAWSIPGTEWTSFRASEKKFKIRDYILYGSMIIVLASVVLYYRRGEGLAFSIIFSSIFTGLFFFLKYILSRSITAGNGKSDMEIIIGPDKLLINGKLFAIKDELRWLEDLKIIDGAKNGMLEFTYGWNTRQGNTTDTLLIPIPEGKRDEAEMLVPQIRRMHGI